MYSTQKEMVKDIVTNMHSFLPTNLLKELAHKPTMEIVKQYIEKSNTIDSVEQFEEITDKFQKLIAQKVIIVILDHNKVTNQVIRRLEIDKESYKTVFAEIKGYDYSEQINLMKEEDTSDLLKDAINEPKLDELEKFDDNDVEKFRDDIFKIDATVDIKKDLNEIKNNKVNDLKEEEQLFKKLSEKIEDHREEIVLNPRLIETILTYYINNTKEEYKLLVKNRGNILIKDYLSKPHYTSMTEQCMEFEQLIITDILDKLFIEWDIEISHPEQVL